MKLRLDYNNMMVHTVKNGIADEDITALKLDIDRAFKAVEAGRDGMKWRELPYNQAETVEDILKTAGTIQARFDNFVVLGIGGSALGPIAVHQALPSAQKLQKEGKRRLPELFVEDNVDPERWRRC